MLSVVRCMTRSMLLTLGRMLYEVAAVKGLQKPHGSSRQGLLKASLTMHHPYLWSALGLI